MAPESVTKKKRRICGEVNVDFIVSGPPIHDNLFCFFRYEVFIIGPNGKRFRSRNELKAFFDKTGEKELNPEDFDFSTFGTGTTGRTVPNKPQVFRYLILIILLYIRYTFGQVCQKC